jgi:hypothetical protein
MGGAVPPLPNMPSWRGAQLVGSTGTTIQLSVKLKTARSSYSTCTESRQKNVKAGNGIQPLKVVGGGDHRRPKEKCVQNMRTEVIQMP